MQPPSSALNGSLQHWVLIRAEPSGQFTAQLVGVPELRATAPTREEALEQVRRVLREWLASGELVLIELSPVNPRLKLRGPTDPNDPLEKEFLEDLARFRQEDLERTLKEYDQECSNSSSTPTT